MIPFKCIIIEEIVKKKEIFTLRILIISRNFNCDYLANFYKLEHIRTKIMPKAHFLFLKGDLDN